MSMTRMKAAAWAGWSAAGLGATLAGCAGPLDRSAEESLRESLIASHRQQLQATVAGGVIQVEREPSDVEAQLERDGRIAELDRTSGPGAYRALPEEAMGTDLLGREGVVDVVGISLGDAIRLAVENNLNLGIARLSPVIAENRVRAAEAVFDWLLFTDVDWQKLDIPRPGGTVPGLAEDQQIELLTVTPGLIKPLPTGGQVGISTTLVRDERSPSVFATPRFYEADVLLSLSHPLLRGFGEDVNRAEIRLAESARMAERENLKQTMLQLALSVEQAYWELALAQQRLAVQVRLLERTVRDRDTLLPRAEFDVSPVRITEANSFVEIRRAEVIRARAALRSSSDRLKRLINAPHLPLADESLLVTSDSPNEAPITFSLAESIDMALRNRPELERALLAISDAGVRLRVADNARLPLLDVGAGVRFRGLDTDRASRAYGNIGDLDYIDYLLSGRFEYAPGNRAADAEFTAVRLERQAATLAYRDAVQERVLSVKDALREVLTAYQLIGATRAARRAAADSLRAIDEQVEAGIALTPEFLLDLKLRTQERLAETEIQELEALTTYNTAIAAYHEAVGTLLERNGIGFERP